MVFEIIGKIGIVWRKARLCRYFSTGEQRQFDTALLKGSGFKPRCQLLQLPGIAVRSGYKENTKSSQNISKFISTHT